MYSDWFEDMPIIISQEDIDNVKLSLHDKIDIWFYGLKCKLFKERE